MVGAVPDNFRVVAISSGFGVFDGEDTGKFVVGDLNGGYGCWKNGPVGMGEEEDGFFRVVDEAVGEDRLLEEAENHE